MAGVRAGGITVDMEVTAVTIAMADMAVVTAAVATVIIAARRTTG